jgi:hypothetical protein
MRKACEFSEFIHPVGRPTVERRVDVRLITTYYDLPCFFIHTLIALKTCFFFVDVRHCFGLQETQAASADAHPNLHPKLGASQSFSRKITTRYLLKPIIPVITYYHSTLRMTNSRSPAGCQPITTQLVLFSSLIFDKGFFLR